MYSQYFNLRDRLEADPLLIPAVELYDNSDDALYAAHMDMLAQPMPDGSESPFSSKDPGSAHALIVAVIVHLQRVHGHEFNLFPDRLLLEWFRILGAEMEVAEYPVINLVFRRTNEAIGGLIDAVVPANIEIRSTRDPDIAAYTLYETVIDGVLEEITVPARMNRIGSLPNLRLGEMAELPRFLSFISSVRNDGTVISPGRNPEQLVDAVLRVRDGIRTSSLGRDPIDGLFDPNNDQFQARCITDADWSYWAKRLGCTKVNVLSAIQYGVTNGIFSDLTTLVVYPSTLDQLVFNSLVGMTVEPRRFDVRQAEIIPVNGTIKVKVIPTVPDSDVFNIVAQAIVEKVNPPEGIWGDRRFGVTLATALEETYSIYAVPEITLKHAETDQAIADLEIQPWHLFEIQESLVIETLR